jgi:hypothetical protein
MKTAMSRGVTRRRDNLQGNLPLMETLAGFVGNEIFQGPEIKLPDHDFPPILPGLGVVQAHQVQRGLHGLEGRGLRGRDIEPGFREEIIIFLVVFMEVADKDPGHPLRPGQAV